MTERVSYAVTTARRIGAQAENIKSARALIETLACPLMGWIRALPSRPAWRFSIGPTEALFSGSVGYVTRSKGLPPVHNYFPIAP